MLVLLAATLVEHVAGTCVMMATFVGLAATAYSIASTAGMVAAGTACALAHAQHH